MIDFDKLRRKPDYFQNDLPPGLRNILRSLGGFSWFIKDNRAELVREGAVVRLGRDYFIQVEVFPRVAQSILLAKAGGAISPEQDANQ